MFLLDLAAEEKVGEPLKAAGDQKTQQQGQQEEPKHLEGGGELLGGLQPAPGPGEYDPVHKNQYQRRKCQDQQIPNGEAQGPVEGLRVRIGLCRAGVVGGKEKVGDTAGGDVVHIGPAVLPVLLQQVGGGLGEHLRGGVQVVAAVGVGGLHLEPDHREAARTESYDLVGVPVVKETLAGHLVQPVLKPGPVHQIHRAELPFV